VVIGKAENMLSAAGAPWTCRREFPRPWPDVFVSAPFEGKVLVEQPRQGRVCFGVTDPFVFDLKIAPRAGTLDLCGLPW
jgi:hypothetical protein